MKLKHIVAALALCASTLPTFAAPSQYVLDLSPDNQVNMTLGTVGTFSGLSDVLITFDYFTAIGIPFSLGTVGGASLSLVPGGPSSGLTATGASTSSNLFGINGSLVTYSATFQNVLAGNYGIQLTGTDGGQFIAVTNVTSSVTAVPEPESYAMLLAGLGALGFMGRRRKAKQA